MQPTSPQGTTDLLTRADDLFAGVLDECDRCGVRLSAELLAQVREWAADYRNANPVTDDERSNGPRR